MEGKSKTKRAAALLAVALVAFGVGALARAGEADTLRDRAADLREENATLGEEASRALLQLYAAEEALRRSERRVSALTTRLDVVREERGDAERRTRAARGAMTRAEEDRADRLRALYKSDELDPLEVLLGARSIEDAITTIDDLRRVARSDERLVEQLGGARRALARATQELAQRQQSVRAMGQDARLAMAERDAARVQQAAYLGSLEERQQLNARQIEDLTSRAGAIEAEARRLEEELAAAAAESPPPGPPAAPSPSPSTPPEPIPPITVDPPDGSTPRPPANAKTLTVTSTGYALKGTTAIGLPVQAGVVAVDPNVIPLGTRMTIPGYGDGVAADTGSAVKGAIIDLWFPTVEEALAWGRRTVTITLY